MIFLNKFESFFESKIVVNGAIFYIFNSIFTQERNHFMKSNDSGVLVLDEWFEAIDSLNSKQYKAIVRAMYFVQRKGEEIPTFEGKSALLAKVIFPHICRRTKRQKHDKSPLETLYGLDPETAKIQEKLMQKTKELKEGRY